MPYMATICILVDVEEEAQAMDAIAETMRPLMQDFNPVSCLRDWQWCLGERELIRVEPIPEDFKMDDTWPSEVY